MASPAALPREYRLGGWVAGFTSRRPRRRLPGGPVRVKGMDTPWHRPVLLPEVLGQLGARPDGWYVDGTVGDGGHSEALLRAAAPNGKVLGIDRDPRSLVRAAARLQPFNHANTRPAAPAPFTPVKGSYADLLELAGQTWGPGSQADGILLDLGISSRQVDAPGFGGSFQRDEPLDMRFDPAAAIPTAADLVNACPAADLARILREYGEEPRARAIARAIVNHRPISTTGQLAALIAQVSGNPGHRRGGRQRIHPATRAFQALRIAVNDELNQLTAGLNAAPQLLKPGGRLAVISYHSLEDRIVKRTLTTAAAACICPPGLPVCRCDHQPTLRLVNRRVIKPGPAEIAANPRSRSARLRVAERLAA